jgi:hypothetical protein
VVILGNKYFVSVALVLLLFVSVYGLHLEIRETDTQLMLFDGSCFCEETIYLNTDSSIRIKLCNDDGHNCYIEYRAGNLVTGFDGGDCTTRSFLNGYLTWLKVNFYSSSYEDYTVYINYGEAPPPTIQVLGEPEGGFGYPPSDGSMIEIDEDSESHWYGQFMLKEDWDLIGIDYDSEVFENVSTQYIGLDWYKYSFDINKSNMSVGVNYPITFNASYTDEPATITYTKEFGDLHFLVVEGEPKSVYLDDIYIDGGWFFNSETGKWEYYTDEGIWLVFDPVTGKVEVRKDNDVTKDASGTINTGGKELLYVTKDSSVTTTVGDVLGEYHDEAITIGGYDYNQYITIDGVDYGVDDSGNIHWVPGVPSKTELIMQKPIYFDDDLWGQIKKFFYDLIFPDDWSMWDSLRTYLANKFPFSMFIRLGEGEYTWFTNEEVNVSFNFSFVDEMFDDEVDLASGWLEKLGAISRVFTRWLFIALFMIFIIRRFIPTVVFK